MARRDADAQVQQSITALDEHTGKLEKLEGERSANIEERADYQARQSRVQAQLKVLEEAEESLTGYADGARYLLEAARQSRLRSNGVLSAVLDVPAELETAIAAALGDILDAVLLDADQVENALALLESDDSGRAALLPLNGRTSPLPNQQADEDYLGLASDLIKAPAELRGAVNLVLGSTFIVRGRATARRLIGRVPIQGRVVTLRGEVFRGDGLIIAGKSASTSTLSRPREKRELGESLASLTARLESLDTSIADISNQLTAARQEQARREQQMREARAESERTLANEQKSMLTAENVRRQLEWQKQQYAELEQDLSEAQKDRQNPG